MSVLADPVLVIGGGGHAKVVIDLLRAGGWYVHGVLDPAPGGGKVLGVEVLGGDELAPAIYRQGVRNAFVALGNNGLRLRIGRRMQSAGFKLVTVVHPSAIVSTYATLGEGTAVMPLAVVNAAARVGDLAIVNTGAIVEHDCSVGDGAHLAPRSVMGGNVVFGNCAQLGIGAAVRPGICVGDNATIGAGAVVVAPVCTGETVAGVPARPMARGHR
ncbi:MAG: acetyltransferase [Acidisphaera sp.]|nr:acetyltransferase [Acidisphaera sp.]